MKLFDIRKVMVLVAISIHEARVSSTFFGGLKASRRGKLKKLIIWKILSQTKWLLYFLNSFQRALLWQSLGIWIFSSCTRIRCIYRKSLLNHIVFVCGCRWPHLAGTISMGRAFLCIPRRPHLGNLSGLLKPGGEVPVVQMVKVKPSTNIGWVRF